MKQFRPLFVITLALFFLCCLVYPAVVTAAAQVLFRDQANGSLVERDGKVRGLGHHRSVRRGLGGAPRIPLGPSHRRPATMPLRASPTRPAATTVR